MLNTRSLRLAGAVALMALAGVLSATATAKTTASTLTIWADASRTPATQKVATAWGNSHGVTVSVVQKDFGTIRSSLATVDAATAPDVIIGASDWIGELSANGSS